MQSTEQNILEPQSESESDSKKIERKWYQEGHLHVMNSLVSPNKRNRDLAQSDQTLNKQ
jgi:hypothetical protein